MSEIARPQSGFAAARHAQPPAPFEEVSYYYADQGEQTHLRDYWNVLLKRARYVIAVVVGVVALGALVSLASTPLYTATSVLKIEPQNPTVTGLPEVAPSQASPGPYDYYQTQFALLKSAPVAARVIKDLRLESNESFTGPKSGPSLIGMAFGWISDSLEALRDAIASLFEEQGGAKARENAAYELGVHPGLIARYNRLLEITPVRNTRLVEVSFSTPDPKLSQDLANAHATAFIRMVLENRFNLTEEARDFLRKKLAELREKVVRAETELNRFRQEHGVVSLEKGENIVVERLVDLNRELTKVRAQRIDAESLHRMVENKNVQYLSQVLTNPLIMQLKGQIANLETEKGRLGSIFQPDHPRMQELNQQLNEAKRALNAEIGNIVRGIESSYAAARAREEALEAEAKRQQEAALNLKEVGVEYAVLNEEVLVNRSLYENVLKRMNETAVANDLAAANIQITQRAEMPTWPSSPQTARNVILASLLGLLLGVGLAFFLEYMDFSVGTPQHVWKAVSLTTLGVIPNLNSLTQRYHPVLSNDAPTNRLEQLPNAEHLSKELVVARNQLSMIAESYRTIRTALLLSQAERPPQVILLTSPCPDEGKTVTTLNLGISLAQAGHKVLVVDADLRKGRCHKLVNLQNHRGLANVLTGQLDLEQSIRPTAVDGFYLLPRGVLPPNPADLLLSQKMREVLNHLRVSFEFILIDSPPVIAVSDATVLSALSDGVLLVLHAQKTTTAAARGAVERLEAVGASMLGVILNSADMRDPDYVHYRSYYPSYYASVQQEALLRGADRPRPAEDKPAPNKPNGEALVTRPFFDRMILRLSEVIGPAAFTVVKEQVANLGYSMDAFPKARVGELTQLVSQEILENKLKVRFLRAMSEEIRAL
ncbi:MAG TPA: polysaccharide biosynthesis tyrosine autokinase [Candidatus Acidoferrales bacterium]|nr:polysaccharide biosynthesis tyrosine autokinase [Candidatus Acidoferrales bacterium]